MVISFWNKTLRIPAGRGGRYHIEDLPNTLDDIDSLTLFAQLYFKD
jgi:hypothetical protein